MKIEFLSNAIPLGLWILAGLVCFLGGLIGFEWGKFLSKRKYASIFSTLTGDDFHFLLSDDYFSGFALLEFRKQKGSEQGIMDTLIHGTLLRKSGRPQKALRIHQSLLARPKITKDLKQVISLQMALDYLASSQPYEAEKIVNELQKTFFPLSAKKRNQMLRGILAQTKVAQKDYADALKIYRSLIRQTPVLPIFQEQFLEALLKYAKEQVKLGKLAKAEKILREILANQENHPEALLLSADLALDKKDFNTAEPHLLQYLKGYDEYSNSPHGHLCNDPFLPRLEKLAKEKQEANEPLNLQLKKVLMKGK